MFLFIVYCFSVSALFFEGFGLVPPRVPFSPFFNKFFIWDWWHGMGILRGANLVGMPLLPPDACPFCWLSKKKTKMNFQT